MTATSLSLLVGAALWVMLYFVARYTLSRQTDRFSQRVRLFVPELIAVAGWLALATVGFFWQILLTDTRWMPAGGGDLAPFLYPNYRFAAEHLQQGTIPLWNPHLYSGTPFAADIQTGLFYPINLLLFLLLPELTYDWLEHLAIFHFWLAGLTMYLCLRLLFLGQQRPLISPLAAFAGALAFAFSDLFIVHFGNLNMIAVAAWLPLTFLLFHHALTNATPTRSPRYFLAALSGATLAIATLAGHIQITLFSLVMLGLYALFRLLRAVNPDSATDFDKLTLPDLLRHALRLGFALSLTVLLTVGLSAVMFLPAYEMSRYTPRAELPYAEAIRYSLQPAQLIGLFIPDYFGRDPALHWGPFDRVETGYIGILTLLLALVGLVVSRATVRWYFFGLGVIALLLALGGYAIVHGWLYALVPGFDQLRAPARFILLLDFALAALAALGLNRLMHPLAERDQQTLRRLLRPLMWGGGGLIVVALPLAYTALLITQDRDPAIFNRATAAATGVSLFALLTIVSLIWLYCASRQPHAPTKSPHLRSTAYLLPTSAILIIALDLFTLGHNVDVGHTDPTSKFHHPEAIAYLQADPHLFRIEVATDVWHLWQPNTAMLNNLYDVWGLYNPLTLADTTLYWQGAPPRDTGRYNFLGIKYIIGSKAGAPADGDIVPVFDGDPDINIYLNRATANRVLFVHQATVVPTQAAAWQAVRAADFDPTATVILEEITAPLDESQPPGQAEATLTLLQYDLHTVTVGVQTEQAGYLVLAEAYYPGWQATLNGQPTPIHRANYAFRAVAVPAGEHTVQLRFAPLIWRIGLAVSVISLLGLLGWGAVVGRTIPNS